MKKTISLLKKITRTKKYTFEDSKMRFRSIKPIFPPPGENLQIPNWSVEKFFSKIGYGSKEYITSFESLDHVFKISSKEMKEKEIPAALRKYIKMIIERLKRGVLTFEYLERRNPVRKFKEDDVVE